MSIDQTITQIRTHCSSFNQRVAGAADFATAVQMQTWMTYPAAYVLPVSASASSNDSPNALYQTITETFRVIVVLDNTSDRRGQTPLMTAESIRYELFRAVLNWRPDRNRSATGYEFAGEEMDDFDRATMYYSYTFSRTLVITEEDGYIEPSEDYFDNVVTGIHPETGETMVTAVAIVNERP